MASRRGLNFSKPSESTVLSGRRSKPDRYKVSFDSASDDDDSDSDTSPTTTSDVKTTTTGANSSARTSSVQQAVTARKNPTVTSSTEEDSSSDSADDVKVKPKAIATDDTETWDGYDASLRSRRVYGSTDASDVTKVEYTVQLDKPPIGSASVVLEEKSTGRFGRASRLYDDDVTTEPMTSSRDEKKSHSSLQEEIRRQLEESRQARLELLRRKRVLRNAQREEENDSNDVKNDDVAETKNNKAESAGDAVTFYSGIVRVGSAEQEDESNKSVAATCHDVMAPIDVEPTRLSDISEASENSSKISETENSSKKSSKHKKKKKKPVSSDEDITSGGESKKRKKKSKEAKKEKKKKRSKEESNSDRDAVEDKRDKKRRTRGLGDDVDDVTADNASVRSKSTADVETRRSPLRRPQVVTDVDVDVGAASPHRDRSRNVSGDSTESCDSRRSSNPSIPVRRRSKDDALNDDDAAPPKSASERLEALRNRSKSRFGTDNRKPPDDATKSKARGGAVSKALENIRHGRFVPVEEQHRLIRDDDVIVESKETERHRGIKVVVKPPLPAHHSEWQDNVTVVADVHRSAESQATRTDRELVTHAIDDRESLMAESNIVQADAGVTVPDENDGDDASTQNLSQSAADGNETDDDASSSLADVDLMTQEYSSKYSNPVVTSRVRLELADDNNSSSVAENTELEAKIVDEDLTATSRSGHGVVAGGAGMSLIDGMRTKIEEEMKYFASREVQYGYGEGAPAMVNSD